MKKIALLLFIVGAVMAIQSCKEEEDPKPPDPFTIDEEALYGTWVASAARISPQYDYFKNGKKISDIYRDLKECQKDDEFVFLSDGTYQTKQGNDTCSGGFDDQGTWVLHKADNEIVVTLQGRPAVTWDIRNFENGEMVAKTYFNENNVSYTETWTYQKL